MDNILAFHSINNILENIAGKAKTRRLEKHLTQEGLAKRSGVSLGSIKRFENKGMISLENLAKIAMVLGHIEDFEELFKEKENYNSLDEALKTKHKPKRGTLK